MPLGLHRMQAGSWSAKRFWSWKYSALRLLWSTSATVSSHSLSIWSFLKRPPLLPPTAAARESQMPDWSGPGLREKPMNMTPKLRSAVSRLLLWTRLARVRIWASTPIFFHWSCMIWRFFTRVVLSSLVTTSRLSVWLCHAHTAGAHLPTRAVQEVARLLGVVGVLGADVLVVGPGDGRQERIGDRSLPEVGGVDQRLAVESVDKRLADCLVAQDLTLWF